MSKLEHLCDIATFSDMWISSNVATANSADIDPILSRAVIEQAQAEIGTWPDYAPTALVQLPQFAHAAGVGSVLYKDESQRFGLGSFKALGGAYAVLHYLSARLSRENDKTVSMQAIRSGEWVQRAGKVTVASATDGNHGRSVAWGAAQAGCQCKIYVHREVSQARIDAITAYGADIIQVQGDYDDSLRACATDSAQNGWQVISDTSYAGYLDIPLLVMAGYTMMVKEILDQTEKPPTHVFVQAGVGGLAAAVCAAFIHANDTVAANTQSTRFIIAESKHAACVLSSMRHGKPETVSIDRETIMGGLSCGQISLIAWEVLSRCVSAVVSLPDNAVGETMRVLAQTSTLEAGECATPGLIALLATRKDKTLYKHLELNDQSHVVVFGCEGATDPELYARIMAGSPS